MNRFFGRLHGFLLTEIMASIRFDINTKTEDVLARFSGSVKGKTCQYQICALAKLTPTHNLASDVITGPSVKSLGAAVAQALAAGNAKQLILVGRSKAKIQPVIDDIAKHYPSVSVHLVAVDLLDLSSIRGGAKAIMDITNEIHGLVNCAGIMAPVTYSESADGIESQFACNHVAHFLLTNLLMDELARGKAVVVNVSSGGYTLAEVRFDDIDFQVRNSFESPLFSSVSDWFKSVERRGLRCLGWLRTVKDSKHFVLCGVDTESCCSWRFFHCR